jgi:hypothetical protein
LNVFEEAKGDDLGLSSQQIYNQRRLQETLMIHILLVIQGI